MLKISNKKASKPYRESVKLVAKPRGMPKHRVEAPKKGKGSYSRKK